MVCNGIRKNGRNMEQQTNIATGQPVAPTAGEPANTIIKQQTGQNTGRNQMQSAFFRQELKVFIWVTVSIVLALILAIVWEKSPLIGLLPSGCIFQRAMHIYCPGCGGTRACFHMLHLHPVESFLYHPIIPFVVLILADYYIGAVITLIKHNGKRYYYLRDWFCYIALAIVLGNFIIRNVLLIGFHIDYIGDLLRYWQ